MQSNNFDSLSEPEGSFFQILRQPASTPEATKTPEIQIEVEDVPVPPPVQTGNPSSLKLAQARRAIQQEKPPELRRQRADSETKKVAAKAKRHLR
ncbi:hypothetical protein BLNAU_12937 [Blattamonas nauphoetae]|uniref:Uncharacterized protein n=1 Tax=Blattamonas nauphoetae TaxID=2049346 RepID=A0ABQ9XI13_9EUKA|nr:hypothetical protein BLNAU_12937 [Blattamonas nauphoetae]